MTCIVALVDGSQVYIGADSCAADGNRSAFGWVQPKVFARESFVIGYTTSFRMGQLLQYRLATKPRKAVSVHEYMCTQFVDAVRDCLKAGGFAKKKDEEESGGNFLVDYEGHLFRVASDYQVGEPSCGYDALGSGAECALGALFATQGKPALERITAALRAAAEFSTTVRPPFKWEVLG